MPKTVLILVLTLCCGVARAFAHQTSDSYLAFLLKNDWIEGRWAIALRDLDHLLEIDADKNGEVSDSELTNSTPKIEDYALNRLSVQADGKLLKARKTGFELEERSDVPYVAVNFEFKVDSTPSDFIVKYALFNDADPLHRGFFRFDLPGKTETAIFSPRQPVQRFVIGTVAVPQTSRIGNFVREGIWHIWTGYDHLLFLLTLLLPSVLQREGKNWQPARSAKEALLNVAAVVTAFTIAHSITLTMATLGWVRLASKVVEPLIAVSIAAAAANNLHPILPNRMWIIAFGFGLIHGFGFAGQLIDLSLPASALAMALFGFNVGVEIGQLAIVLAFVPIAFALRGRSGYRQVVLRFGSVVTIVIAAAWFVERVTGTRIIPF